MRFAGSFAPRGYADRKAAPRGANPSDSGSRSDISNERKLRLVYRVPTKKRMYVCSRYIEKSPLPGTLSLRANPVTKFKQTVWKLTVAVSGDRLTTADEVFFAQMLKRSPSRP